MDAHEPALNQTAAPHTPPATSQGGGAECDGGERGEPEPAVIGGGMPPLGAEGIPEGAGALVLGGRGRPDATRS